MQVYYTIQNLGNLLRILCHFCSWHIFFKNYIWFQQWLLTCQLHHFRSSSFFLDSSLSIHFCQHWANNQYGIPTCGFFCIWDNSTVSFKSMIFDSVCSKFEEFLGFNKFRDFVYYFLFQLIAMLRYF